MVSLQTLIYGLLLVHAAATPDANTASKNIHQTTTTSLRGKGASVPTRSLSDLEYGRFPCSPGQMEKYSTCGYLEDGGRDLFTCEFGATTLEDGRQYCCLDPNLRGQYPDPCENRIPRQPCKASDDDYTCGILEFGGSFAYTCLKTQKKHDKIYCCADPNETGRLDPCSDGFVGDACASESDCQGGNSCALWSIYSIQHRDARERQTVCCNGGSLGPFYGGQYLCFGLPKSTQCWEDCYCESGNCQKDWWSLSGVGNCA